MKEEYSNQLFQQHAVNNSVVEHETIKPREDLSGIFDITVNSDQQSSDVQQGHDKALDYRRAHPLLY